MQTSLLFISLLASLTSACLYPRAESPNTNQTTKPYKPAYTYDGETGPLGWHLLPNNTICGTGKHQSPINITPRLQGVTQVKDPLKLSYPQYSKEVDVDNNGRTIVYTPRDAGNYTSVLEGKEYKLLQFHFHTPSEHRFADESYPLEVHFVHEDKEGKLAVVGVFFELGFDWLGDKFLRGTTPALQNLKNAGDKQTIRDVSFKSIMDVTSQSKVFTYDGSLTTPPCSEGVRWYVVEDSLNMSVAQFQAWKSVMKFNCRNTQNAPGTENLIQYSAERAK